MGENELTAEKFAEQIRQLKIEDIVLSTMSTLGQLAYAKLDAKDLDQARLAIDAIAALLQTVEERIDAQALRDFKQLLANVQLAFASTASASEGDAEVETSHESPSASEPQTP